MCGAVAPPVAIRATDKNIAQELHFDLLKTGAPAAFALALRGIETEGAGAQAALFGGRGPGKQLANFVKRPDINRRIGARRPAQQGLVHRDDPAQMLPSFQQCAGRRRAPPRPGVSPGLLLFGRPARGLPRPTVPARPAAAPRAPACSCRSRSPPSRKPAGPAEFPPSRPANYADSRRRKTRAGAGRAGIYC